MSPGLAGAGAPKLAGAAKGSGEVGRGAWRLRTEARGESRRSGAVGCGGEGMECRQGELRQDWRRGELRRGGKGTFLLACLAIGMAGRRVVMNDAQRVGRA